MTTVLGKKISDTLILLEDGSYLIAQCPKGLKDKVICFFEIDSDGSQKWVNDTQVAPKPIVENFKRRELLGFPLLKSSCK